MLVFVLLFAVLACNDKSVKEKELELKERELNLRESELKNKLEKEATVNSIEHNKPQSQTNENTPENNNITIVEKNATTKYILVLVHTKEPKLYHDVLTSHSPLDASPDKEVNYVSFVDYAYYSDVIEVKNFTESSKYRAMDNFEKGIQNKLFWVNRNFESEVKQKVLSSRSEQDRLLEAGEAKIADRKCFVFNTYSEASQSRNKKNNAAEY